MIDPNIFVVVASALGLAAGVRLLKFEHGNETTITGRDLLAFALIALSISGSVFGLNAFQANAVGGGGAPALYRCPVSPTNTTVSNTLCYGPGGSGLVDNVNTAFQCGNGFNFKQCGTATCTIPAGGTVCTSTTITFSPAFPAPPNIVFDPQVWPSTNEQFYTSYCFVCPSGNGTGLTVSNMPAATTEIFGDTNAQHEIFFGSVFGGPLLSAYNSAELYMSCLTGSTNIGALIIGQYSFDQGTTWTSLTGVGTGLGFGTSNCPTSAGFYDTFSFNLPAAVTTPVTCTVSPCLALRIATSGGNGAGDSPVLYEVGIHLFGVLNVPIRLGYSTKTASSWSFRCIAPAKVGTATACSSHWFAEVA